MQQETNCSAEEYNLSKRILDSQQQVVLQPEDITDDILLNDVVASEVNETHSCRWRLRRGSSRRTGDSTTCIRFQYRRRNARIII